VSTAHDAGSVGRPGIPCSAEGKASGRVAAATGGADPAATNGAVALLEELEAAPGRTARAAAGWDATGAGHAAPTNRSAADVGSAVHLVMERVPLMDPEIELTDLVRDACAEFGV
jgi:hypothetical protein